MWRATLMVILCMQPPPLFVDSARILGVFPVPSISHQVVFRALMMELAKRGHELVIITPDPILEKNRPPDNITEIDTSSAYALMSKLRQEASGSKRLKRGVIMDVDTMTDSDSSGMTILVSHVFDIPEVEMLLKNKSQKFDLVFMEALCNYHLIVSTIFKAPVVLFSSFHGFPEDFETMGAVARHPVYYPNFWRKNYRNLSIWGKIKELYMEYKIYRFMQKVESEDEALLKKNFGKDAPTVAELKKNVEMFFVNAHPLFANNRPVPPSVVFLGALHLQPVQELPQDLKLYLDNSKTGVVYVSLGTNIEPTMMDEDLINVFVETFKAIPYDVLWKFDGEYPKDLPANVRIQKWFPQRDLLMHTNIKLFVTQGGLQSTDEAIDAAVPLVGVPMLGDQWFNVNKYVELGIGVYVDALTMDAADLISGINHVVANSRHNIRRVRTIVNDQPQTALERGVWWTEYIIRHGGARHLQAPSAGSTWTEYFMLDVVILVLSAITTTIFIVNYICVKIINFFKPPPPKEKPS